MELKGYAKVNLALGVKGKSSDYHDLDTLMVQIDVYDTLKVIPRTDGKVTLSYTNGEKYPIDNAFRAAVTLENRFKKGGLDIEISKNVPSGVGVGGSAVDAAAIVKAYETIYGVKANEPEFLLSLGADVPFLYHGGVAIAQGKGEIIKPVSLPEIYVLLVYGDERVDTKKTFEVYDNIGGTKGTTEEFLKTLKPFNSLETAAETVNPNIKVSKQTLLEAGFSSVVMTGSGSGYLGLEYDKNLFNKNVERAIALAKERNLEAKILKLVKE